MLANNGIGITVIVNNRSYIIFLLHFGFILNIVKSLICSPLRSMENC